VIVLAPQCGHCVSAAPEFEKGASILDGIVHFGAVDMTQHGSLGSQYGIRGYPTFKLFGDDKERPVDYQGQRSAQDFVQFSLTQTKDVVTKRANQGAAGGQKKQSGGSKTGGRKTGGGTSSGGVIELDDASFNERVLNSEEAWFV
jgi:protein disulfide-isomerase A6